MHRPSRFFPLILTVAVLAGLSLLAPATVYAIGTDACPGRLIVIPAAPDSFLDAGNTNNMNNNCFVCSTGDPGGPGRDVFYQFALSRPTYLSISTCGSQYDTYICVFRDSCCSGNQVPLVVNDQDPPLCPSQTTRAVISTCFLNPAQYFLVVTGPNAGAYGSYQLVLKEVPDQTCGETPPIPCTAGYGTHTEGADEAVCEHAFTLMETCPQGYCGAVDRRGDRDVYEFVLTQCVSVTLSVYGNDSPNRSSSGKGLNPRLRLFAGPGCDHPLYVNDDFGGTPPNPVPIGHDSRIVADCLGPGQYWVEISGDTTTGKYEFTYGCATCPRTATPVGGVQPTSPQSGQFCVSWPPQTEGSIYYIWRYVGGTWILAGTTRATQFCETLGAGAQPIYEVFTDPCGIPLPPAR